MTGPNDNFEAFLATLSPEIAKNVRTAATTETIRYPLASKGLTRRLGGGITAGRITTIYGNTSAGKSALVTESVGKLWQPAGLVCAYADVEGTYTKEWGARLGVDNDRLILVGGKSSGKLEKNIRPLLEGGIDILVIDSISDIMPEVFFDKHGNLNDGDDRKQVGAHAKAITSLINGIHYYNHKTAVILISQTTTSLANMYPEQIPHGGKKTEFGSSVMIRLNSSNSAKAPIMGYIQQGDRLIQSPVGREVNAYLKKNKTGTPFTEWNYNFYYDGPKVGVDGVKETIDIGIELGVLQSSGAWISRPSTGEKWNGTNKMQEALRADPSVQESIDKEIHMVDTGEVVE